MRVSTQALSKPGVVKRSRATWASFRNPGIPADVVRGGTREPIRPCTVPGERPTWSRCGGSWTQQAIITFRALAHHITPFQSLPSLLSYHQQPTHSHTHTRRANFSGVTYLANRGLFLLLPFPRHLVVLEVKVGVFLQVQRTVRDGDGAFVDAVDALTSASVAGFVVLSGGSGWDSEWEVYVCLVMVGGGVWGGSVSWGLIFRSGMGREERLHFRRTRCESIMCRRRRLLQVTQISHVWVWH